jgi:hypothetical protein
LEPTPVTKAGSNLSPPDLKPGHLYRYTHSQERTSFKDSNGKSIFVTNNDTLTYLKTSKSDSSGIILADESEFYFVYFLFNGEMICRYYCDGMVDFKLFEEIKC